MDIGQKENETSLSTKVEMKDESRTNVNVENIPDDGDNDGLPIDRGWAWVIAIATQCNQMLKVGYASSLGILFIEFLRVFKASVTETTLISGIRSGVFGFAGIGNSMIHGPGLVLVGQYFIKKRGLGTAISNSGVSAGSVIVPPIVKLLLDLYGLHGTMLIVGGIELNVLVFACLMRPLDSFKRKTKRNNVNINNIKNSVPYKIVKDTDIKKDKSNGELKISEKEIFNQDNILAEDYLNHKEYLSPLINGDIKHLTASQSSLISNIASHEDMYSIALDSDDNKDNRNEKNKTLNPCKSLDFTLWKKPYFLMMAFNTFCGNFYLLFLSYYPAHVVEKGTSENDATMFLSIAGGLDFFARLLAGYIAHRRCIRRTHICMFSLLITALNCHCIRFYNSYGLQLLGIIIYGIFGGIFNSFTALLLMDFLGSENLAKSLGFIMILNGLSVSISHPIVGALRDYTGSFIPAYHFMGTMLSLVPLVLLLEPLVARCAKRLNNRSNIVP